MKIRALIIACLLAVMDVCGATPDSQYRTLAGTYWYRVSGSSRILKLDETGRYEVRGVVGRGQEVYAETGIWRLEGAALVLEMKSGAIGSDYFDDCRRLYFLKDQSGTRLLISAAERGPDSGSFRFSYIFVEKAPNLPSESTPTALAGCSSVSEPSPRSPLEKPLIARLSPKEVIAIAQAALADSGAKPQPEDAFVLAYQITPTTREWTVHLGPFNPNFQWVMVDDDTKKAKVMPESGYPPLHFLKR